MVSGLGEGQARRLEAPRYDRGSPVGRSFGSSVSPVLCFFHHLQNGCRVLSPCRGLGTGRLTALGRSRHLEWLLWVIALQGFASFLSLENTYREGHVPQKHPLHLELQDSAVRDVDSTGSPGLKVESHISG